MSEAHIEKTPLEHTVERLAPSVVSVKIFKEVKGLLDPKNPERTQESHWVPSAEGSGFFVSKDGMIVTNRHVVSDGSQDEALVVQLDSKKKLTAEVFYIDPVRDFALLKVAGSEHPPLVIGDSDKVKRGATITIAGNPLGIGGSFSQGTVTSVPDNHEQISFKTDADIRSGSSGGVMFNAKDEVIGINTFAHLDSTGSIGGAIPINEVKLIIQHPRVFQGIQVLFRKIQEEKILQEDTEHPLTLKESFDASLEGLERLFKQELPLQGREDSVKAIMNDAAVQYYLRDLLKSARSSKYREVLEKKFGVPFFLTPASKKESVE